MYATRWRMARCFSSLKTSEQPNKSTWASTILILPQQPIHRRPMFVSRFTLIASISLSLSWILPRSKYGLFKFLPLVQQNWRLSASTKVALEAESRLDFPILLMLVVLQYPFEKSGDSRRPKLVRLAREKATTRGGVKGCILSVRLLPLMTG